MRKKHDSDLLSLLEILLRNKWKNRWRGGEGGWDCVIVMNLKKNLNKIF